MNKEKAKAWLVKYEQGTLSGEQRRRLNLFYMQQAAKSSDQLSDEQLEDSYKFLKSSLSLSTTARRVSLWPRIALAAAVATVIFGAGLFYYSSQNRVDYGQVAVRQDVAPGKLGATLTLANGKKIRLNDALNGELALQAGVVVSKKANGQLSYEVMETSGIKEAESAINTLSTEKGETYMLTLPDKSKVWLNSGSSLTYAAKLMQNGKRMVQLKGEGYFQVAKDRSHPFIVRTQKQDVEVLGTQFNVNSYPDEPLVSTTLIEGSVKVSSGGIQQWIKPGQQAISDAQGLIVKGADIDQVTDWKNGDFNLNELDFRQAMRKIARWYDVEVIYDDEVNTNFQTVGWISRSKNLSVVLQSIQSLGRVRFRLEDRKIYVTK